MSLPGWEIGLICGASAVAVIAIGVLLWLWLKPIRSLQNESTPLLDEEGNPNMSNKRSTIAISTNTFGSCFLDQEALQRCISWLQDVAKAHAGGITPLPEHDGQMAESARDSAYLPGRNSSNYLSPTTSTSENGDTDGGLPTTPRSAQIVSPRVSNVDPTEPRRATPLD